MPCDYGNVSTPDPSVTLNPSPDPNIDVGGVPDGSMGTIADGQYIVLSLQITVAPTPDNNYDLAFYEYLNGSFVYLDWIIVGISNDSDGATYYEVFNWGDGTPDDNSNVGNVAGAENDDQTIDPYSASDPLHDPDELPGPDGPAPQTGILIDVDTADSNPPPATYNYVVIISPAGGLPGNDAQVDSVQTVEVPIPTP